MNIFAAAPVPDPPESPPVLHAIMTSRDRVKYAGRIGELLEKAASILTSSTTMDIHLTEVCHPDSVAPVEYSTLQKFQKDALKLKQFVTVEVESTEAELITIGALVGGARTADNRHALCPGDAVVLVTSGENPVYDVAIKCLESQGGCLGRVLNTDELLEAPEMGLELVVRNK